MSEVDNLDTHINSTIYRRLDLAIMQVISPIKFINIHIYPLLIIQSSSIIYSWPRRLHMNITTAQVTVSKQATKLQVNSSVFWNTGEPHKPVTMVKPNRLQLRTTRGTVHTPMPITD